MKITRIETIPIRVPIKPELAIRSGRGGSHTESPFLLVKIHTDEGIVGVGEASCTPRWSGEDQVSAAHFINSYFAPLLMGEFVATGGSPVGTKADEPSATTVLDDIERLSAKFRNTVAGNYFTKAAVEMALWDIAGKALGKPVWELLAECSRHTPCAVAGDADGTPTRHPAKPAAGCPVPATVPTKWSVSGVEPAKAAEIARWAISQGFSAMKVKVGLNPDADAARVRAVRDVVGPQVKLGVDANGGWPTPRIAIDTINRLLDECAIYFAEQPVPAGDHDAMAEVRRGVRVPIVADESVYTLADARMLARAQAADVFSIYIGKAGGIGPAREIAEFGHSAGIKCTIGSNLELGIGSAAMIHLALSAPGIDADTYPCDIIGPLFYEDDILVKPLAIVGGSARPHDRSGLGIELDDEKVEKYRVQ
jgi:muconate cycloisomerase